MDPEARIEELSLELPPAPKPVGVYKPVVVVGSTAYVSGHGPLKSDGTMMSGRVGDEVDQRTGYDAARKTALAVLASLRAELRSLDRIKRIVKTFGMVNCSPDFTEQPAVINGFSELMAEVFGEDNGIGARSAVGMSSLPGNVSVEIEVMFEVE